MRDIDTARNQAQPHVFMFVELYKLLINYLYLYLIHIHIIFYTYKYFLL
jgi:hypothetical protein